MILFAIDPGVNGACSIYIDRKLYKIFDVPTMTDGKKNKKQVQLICFLNESQLTKFKTKMFGQNKDYIIALNDF